MGRARLEEMMMALVLYLFHFITKSYILRVLTQIEQFRPHKVIRKNEQWKFVDSRLHFGECFQVYWFVPDILESYPDRSKYSDYLLFKFLPVFFFISHYRIKWITKCLNCIHFTTWTKEWRFLRDVKSSD